MQVTFDDRNSRNNLYPFAVTRNVEDIRIGILTIKQKWELIFSVLKVEFANSIAIPSNIIPTKNYVEQLDFSGDNIFTALDSTEDVKVINHSWEIFQLNDWALRNDFELITAGRSSQTISSTNQLIAPENIFVEEGAIIEHSILNASTGPIYIGKNAVVMEGNLIRGPFALCEGATLKMGSKIYGATTIGPYSVAGGEIKNSVLFGYSNKAHDGYLGDSVLAEWCNLGAGTSNSNLKNTAGDVNVWDNSKKSYTKVGTKCGLLMGDYSRAAINTSFNTGTVVGVCCNIFGEGFPAKHVPDFSWGGGEYDIEKALQDIDNWKKLKTKNITQQEKEILSELYNQKINIK
ncbi:putative sugar nucleotidyl transferase [Ferruginibacter sp. SUN002]|uniref:putative sugar nucleotidyl transferase n=1 Tax=Ferruginibacter sp. SUN002 TaxID=2937789 RepID=UPI003D3668D8